MKVLDRNFRFKFLVPFFGLIFGSKFWENNVENYWLNFCVQILTIFDLEIFWVEIFWVEIFWVDIFGLKFLG